MPGILRDVLKFTSDSEIVLDFALTSSGAAVDLTGADVEMWWAQRRANTGFGVSVGAGILTPVTDGLAKIRVASSDLADKVSDYDIALKVRLPTQDWMTWVTGRAVITQAVSARAGGSPSLNTGLAGSSAITISADWDPAAGTISVDASPGVAGQSYREMLISMGTLPPTATNDDVNAYVLQNASLVLMANKSFPIETLTCPAGSPGAIQHSAWRDTGVAAGVAHAYDSFSGAVAAAGAVADAWLEFSDTNDDTGVISLQPALIADDGAAVILTSRTLGKYARIAAQNPATSGPAAVLTVKTSYNGE